MTKLTENYCIQQYSAFKVYKEDGILLLQMTCFILNNVKYALLFIQYTCLYVKYTLLL